MESPFIVPVVNLHREGESEPFQKELATPEDVGIELMEIPVGSPMNVDLTLLAVPEGVLVQGNVRAQAKAQCARCLADLTIDMDELVAELVFFPERIVELEAEGDEEAAELPVIEDETIDLEPILRDALVLAMPFRPLCRPDCRGLCSGCGERWDDLPDDHEHEFLDPRFSVLDALAQKLEAEEAEAESAEEER